MEKELRRYTKEGNIVKASFIEVDLILVGSELYSKKGCVIVLSIRYFTCHESDIMR
jgi:hypothetical protein